jgi:hypothetical protein
LVDQAEEDGAALVVQRPVAPCTGPSQDTRSAPLVTMPRQTTTTPSSMRVECHPSCCQSSGKTKQEGDENIVSSFVAKLLGKIKEFEDGDKLDKVLNLVAYIFLGVSGVSVPG